MRAIQALLLRADPVDVITVAEELKRQGVFEESGGHTTLALLQEEGTVATSAASYLLIIRECAARRELIREARLMLERAYDEKEVVQDIIGDHVTAVIRVETEYAPNKVIGPKPFAEELRTGSEPSRIQTGLMVFDEIAGGGVTTSDLIVVAGRPGMGKTATGVQIAYHTSTVLGVPTLFLSLDMTRRQIGKRYLSFASLETLEDSGFHIADPTAPKIGVVAAMVRRMVTQHAIQVVVLDHLHKVKPTRQNPMRHLEVAEIATGLRDLARGLDIPIIVLCQMSRAVEKRNDPRPVLSDLRESGAIEEEAAMVVFQWSPDERRIGKDPLPIVLSLEKNRHGPTGDCAYTFLKSRGRIEAATR